METYFTVRLWIDYYIPLIAIAVVVLATSYNEYKKKRKTNKKDGDKNDPPTIPD